MLIYNIHLFYTHVTWMLYLNIWWFIKFHTSYRAADVAGPLCYQDGGLPVALLCKVTFMEICMDQENDHLPFQGVW